MSTITAEQQAAIAAKLAGMTLPEGIGTTENACSIAAINLALTGTLTDDIPPCMSEVIGKWIISAQDAMPSEMRNSSEWKELLPLAAGTGRDREKERLEIIMQWMWNDVLPTAQPIADRSGFGAEWRAMTDVKAAEAGWAAVAVAARSAAAEVAVARAAAAAEAAEAVWAAGWGDAAALAAEAAAWTVRAAGAAVRDAAAWAQFNPCGLLRRLIEA
jgi:hypothetical protein